MVHGCDGCHDDHDCVTTDRPGALGGRYPAVSTPRSPDFNHGELLAWLAAWIIVLVTGYLYIVK